MKRRDGSLWISLRDPYHSLTSNSSTDLLQGKLTRPLQISHVFATKGQWTDYHIILLLTLAIFQIFIMGFIYPCIFYDWLGSACTLNLCNLIALYCNLQCTVLVVLPPSCGFCPRYSSLCKSVWKLGAQCHTILILIGWWGKSLWEGRLFIGFQIFKTS